MNGRDRIAAAMRLGFADRVPVMCQLSIGHYFLHSGIDPIDIWFTSEGFASALVALAEKYHFDGILINLPGRDPSYKNFVKSIDKRADELLVHWKNGYYTVVPKDDNPHYYNAEGQREFPSFHEIDPENLYYVEPWDITEVNYPYIWGFEPSPRPFDDFFPDYHFDTIRLVREKTGGRLSVHTEVFSPWSQFLELFNYENALIAIIDDPVKSKKILERLSVGAADLACKQAAHGADAVLISSAFAGAGLISREHYIEFVLPYEKYIIDTVKRYYDIPVYTHTCGSIGDRLDLMMQSGTNGIDTLDPPPLGTVELEEAKKQTAQKVFIKGNIDPVNTLLLGSLDAVAEDARKRTKIGMQGGGYILSSACSVAPHTPPENIAILSEIGEKFGNYSHE